MNTAPAETARSETDQRVPRRHHRRRWFGRIAVVALILIALASAPFINNNFRLTGGERAEFDRDLDASIERSIVYLDSHRLALTSYQPNGALLYMVRDMAEMTGDARLKQITLKFREYHPHHFWNRLVFSRNPNDCPKDLEPLTAEQLAALEEFQRWIHYAIEGDESVLKESDKASFFSPTAHNGRDLTHQLIALVLLKRRCDDNANLPPLVDTVSQRIARQAMVDFRVSDMYVQRVSFLLDAGHDDLVRPRWIEQILANQQEDGGWHYFYRSPIATLLTDCPMSDDHATVQAAWALCMVKYRYTSWKNHHYPQK